MFFHKFRLSDELSFLSFHITDLIFILSFLTILILFNFKSMWSYYIFSFLTLVFSSIIQSFIQVFKKGDAVKHIVKGEKPLVATQINATIDWDKRYKYMKMHSAQHILSGVVFDNYGARTVGNQIHADYSRVDFHPVKFLEKDLEDIVNKFNFIISMNLPVKIYEEERTSLEKRVDTQRANLDLLPKYITKLRIVEIQGFDICPCAGTHVRNTSEIPHIKEVKRETKGKDTDRIIYSLDY